MGRVFLKICIFTFLISPGMAYSADEQHKHMVAGRMGLHGMVLFGAGPYFLDHIPMNHPPHDFQILAEVLLFDKSGNLIKEDFSNEGFTMKPSESFSLDEYISGKIKSFSGEVYKGSFEQGGSVFLREVTIQVKLIKYARQLLSKDFAAELEENLQLSDGHNAFQINVITPKRNLQVIKNLTTGKVLWCVVGPEFFDFCPGQ